MDSGQLEVWFLTGSQSLYGEATLRQVDEQSRGSSGLSESAPASPWASSAKPVLTTPDDIRELCLEANATTLRRRHRLDAHLLAGQDVDRRAAGSAEAVRCTCTRSSTATCRGPTSTWTS